MEISRAQTPLTRTVGVLSVQDYSRIDPCRISFRSASTCGGGQALSVIAPSPPSTLRKEPPFSTLPICANGMTSATRPAPHGVTEMLRTDLSVTATTCAPRNPCPPRPTPCATTRSPSTSTEAASAVRRAPTYAALPRRDTKNRMPRNTAKPPNPERAVAATVPAPNAKAAPVVSFARPSRLATRASAASGFFGCIVVSSSVSG
jgi:hypothetical protein